MKLNPEEKIKELHLNLLLNENNANNLEKIHVTRNNEKHDKNIDDGNFEKFKEIFNRFHYSKMYNNEDLLNNVSANAAPDQDSNNDFLQKFLKLAKNMCENPVAVLNEYINVALPNYYDKFNEEEMGNNKSRSTILKNEIKSTLTKDNYNFKTCPTVINENNTYRQATNNICAPNISVINKCNDRILECHNSKKFNMTQGRHKSWSSHQNEIKCPNDKNIIEMIMKNVLPAEESRTFVHLYQIDSNKQLKQSIWQKAATELYDINKPSRDLNSFYEKKGDKKSLENFKGSNSFNKVCRKSLKTRNKKRIINPSIPKESVGYCNSISNTKICRKNDSKYNNHDHEETAYNFVTPDNIILEKNLAKKVNNLNPNYNLNHICCYKCSQNMNIFNAKHLLRKKFNDSSVEKTISSTSSINSLNYKKIWRKAAKELCKYSPEITYKKNDSFCNNFATSDDTASVNSVYYSDALSESQMTILSKENINTGSSTRNRNENVNEDQNKHFNYNKYCNSSINDKCSNNRFVNSNDKTIKKQNRTCDDLQLNVSCINDNNIDKIVKSNRSDRSVRSIKSKGHVNKKNKSNNFLSCVSDNVKNILTPEDDLKTLQVKCHKMKDYRCKKSLSEEFPHPKNEINKCKRIGEQKIKPRLDYVKNNCDSAFSLKKHGGDKVSKTKIESTNISMKTNYDDISQSNDKRIFLTHNNHEGANFYGNEDIFFDSNNKPTHYCSIENDLKFNYYKNKSEVNISNKNYSNFDPVIKLPEYLCNTNYLNYNSMKFNNYFNVTLTCNPALFNIGRRKSKIKGDEKNSKNRKKLFPKRLSQAPLFLQPLRKRYFSKDKDNHETLKRTSDSELLKKSDHSSLASTYRKKNLDELIKINDKNSKRQKKYRTNQENPKKDLQSKNKKEYVKNYKITDDIKYMRSPKSIATSEDTDSWNSFTGGKIKRSSTFSIRSLHTSSKSDALINASSHSANFETNEKQKVRTTIAKPSHASMMDNNKFFGKSRKLPCFTRPSRSKLAELMPSKEKFNDNRKIDVLNVSKSSHPSIKLLHPSGTVHGLDGSNDQNEKGYHFVKFLLSHLTDGISLFSRPIGFVYRIKKQEKLIYRQDLQTYKKPYCKRASPDKNGFFCCCNQDCSFKESLKRMFCISLPSKTSSETRSCWFRNKHTTETKCDDCTCTIELSTVEEKKQ